jgi:hypothetical protein
MKKGMILAMLVLAALSGYSQEAERQRGPYFEIGLGLNVGLGPKGINYNTVLKDIKETADDAGFKGFTPYIDLSAGWAVLDNLYAVGTIFGMADVLFKDGDALLLGFRVYGIGGRFYPIKTHLQIGLDLGLATTEVVSSTYQNVKNNIGFGSKVSVAYDFSKKKTGPTALAGGFIANFVEGEAITAFNTFVKFVYK